MTHESSGPARQEAYASLLDSLLDAREDPVTARFDAELDAAVRSGVLPAGTARRLRFWQRASLHALADHTRMVLPTVLGALDAARDDTAHVLAGLTETLGDEPSPTPDQNGADDTPEAASSPQRPGPSTLEQRHHRLIVADLVATVPHVKPNNPTN